MIYDEPVGVIRDHSNGVEYRPNSDCSFLIDIPGAPTVSLVFSSFQLEDFYDYIIIYDGDNERKQCICFYLCISCSHYRPFNWIFPSKSSSIFFQ